LRQLRKTDATKAIPVIIMTANWEAIVREESEVAGASLFVTKPFSPAQLLTHIRKFIPETPPGVSA
jgi:CheY-like chemotaxis protein